MYLTNRWPLVDAPVAPWYILEMLDAVQAVVLAEVGQSNFQQRNAAAIVRIAVANARAFGRANALAAHRMALGRAARGTRGIVFGSVGQDGQFGWRTHCLNIR